MRESFGKISWGITLLLSGVAVALAIGLLAAFSEDRPQVGSNGSERPGRGRTQDLEPSASKWIRNLTSRGWRQPAAEAVVDLNRKYLHRLHEAAPKELKQEITHLGRLGNKPSVQQNLVEHPELAGLLADSLEADQRGPRRILESLSDADNRAILMSLYGLHAAPADASTLARTLNRDGDLIARLLRQGAWDAVGWFEALPAKPQARAEYRLWLRDLFDQALRATNPAALDRAQTLLAIHAAKLRDKLGADPAFREDFRSDLWPMYANILEEQMEKDRSNEDASHTGWGIYIQDPRVWDVLGQWPKKGKTAFENYGPLAVDLLADPFYQDCRDQVLKALARKDGSTVAALYNEHLRDRALFKQLLERDLPGGTLAKAFFNLQADTADIPRKLSYYNRLSDAALIEELGPPPEGAKTWVPGYAVYYLGKKYAQGRDITGMDVAMAAVDTAELVIGARGGGKALKTIGKGLSKGLAKRAGSQVARESLEEAIERTGRAEARELFPWVLREGHRKLRHRLAKITAGSQLDVTRMVRFAFRKSRMGRASFKRFSDLDARIFMRGDRRIVFDLPALLEGSHPIGRYLRETALNAGVDTTLKTQSGAQAVETTVQAGRKAARRTAKEMEAWRKHIAAWWLANAADGLKSPN